jgi:hypothetical protein
MGCRREQAQPEQIVAPETVEPQTPGSSRAKLVYDPKTAATVDPSALPLPALARTIEIPAPAPYTDRQRARARPKGQVVVIERRGAVLLWPLQGMARGIGAFRDGADGGCAMGSARWSADRAKILIYVDINSSDNWCLFDNGQFMELNRYLYGIHSATPWRVEWFGPDRLISDAGGSVPVVSRCRPDHESERTFSTAARLVAPHGSGNFWVAPDQTYAVLAGTPPEPRAETLLATLDTEGDWGREQPCDVYPDTGRWGDTDDRVWWPPGTSERFLVRTGPIRLSVRDRSGEEVGWRIFGSGLCNVGAWASVAFSPDGEHAAVLSEAGDLYVLAPKEVRLVCRAGQTPGAATWSPDGKWLVTGCALEDRGAVVLYRPSEHRMWAVVGDRGLGFLEWSPDSRYLASITQDEGEPGVLNAIDTTFLDDPAAAPVACYTSRYRGPHWHANGWTADSASLCVTCREGSSMSDTPCTVFLMSVTGDGSWQVHRTSGLPSVALSPPGPAVNEY